MLPPTKTNLNILVNITDGEPDIPRPKELSQCDILRTDVAKFQTDLANGHLAKGWLKSAEKAMVDRAAGKFDEWKKGETEIWWGQG
jgi:hypothetical protein